MGRTPKRLPEHFNPMNARPVAKCGLNALLLQNESAHWKAVFERWPRREYLDRAVSLFKRSECPLSDHDVYCISPFERARRCRSLAELHMLRHIRFSTRGDLEHAIKLNEEAIALFPEGHVDRVPAQLYLGFCIRERYDRSKKAKDLELAASLANEILRQCHPGHLHRAAALDNLAETMICAYDSLKDIETLQHVIELHSMALDLRPLGHLERPLSLRLLSTALVLRFDAIGNRADIDLAICLSEERLGLTPEPDPARSDVLHLLANMYYTRAEMFQDPDDYSRCFRLSRQLLQRITSSHPLRATRFRLWVNRFHIRYDQTEDSSLLEELLLLYEELRELIPHDDPTRPTLITHYADALESSWAHTSPSRESLVTFVELCKEGIAQHSPDQPRHSAALHSMGTALYRLSKLNEHECSLDEAISYVRQSLAVTRDQDAMRLERLIHLATYLRERYQTSLTPSTSDLVEAISFAKKVLDDHSTDHDLRAAAFIQLVGAMHLQADVKEATTSDWESLVKLGERIALACPADNDTRPATTVALAKAFQNLFTCSWDSKHLLRASSLLRDAIRIYTKDHPHYLPSVMQLANVLSTLHSLRKDMQPLEEAISLYHEILSLSSDNDHMLPQYLSGLARNYQLRYKQTRHDRDLDRAFGFCKDALNLARSNSEQRICLTIQAEVLQEQYNYNRSLDILNQCIGTWEVALRLCPQESTDHCDCVDGLSLALLARTAHVRELNDIDRAIELPKVALRKTPPSHAHSRRYLHTIIRALEKRFADNNDPSDLEEMLYYSRQLTSLPAGKQIDRIIDLGRYATALAVRYSSVQDRRDLDLLCHIRATILAFQPNGAAPDAALASIKSGMLFLPLPPGTLSTALQAMEGVVEQGPGSNHELEAHIYESQYERTGDHQYLDKAESAWAKTLAGLQDSSTHHRAPHIFRVMASICNKRSRKLGSMTELDRAIDYAKSALEHPALSESQRPTLKQHLASMIIRRNMGEDGDNEQRLLARDLLRDVANMYTCRLDIRFVAAIYCSTLSMQYRFESAMEECRLAFTLLPQLAWLGADTRASLHAIENAKRFPADASIYAVSQSRLEEAVEFLESGRSVIWGQASMLRTPVDQLAVASPDLARRIRVLSLALEGYSQDEGSRQGHGILIERTSWQIRQDWLDTLSEIRCISGFEDFLTRKRYSSLAKAARDGPVVLLIPHAQQSLALVIESPDSVPACINLPISLSRLQQLRASLRIIVHSRAERAGDPDLKETTRAGRRKAAQSISSNAILEILWKEIAKPVVEFLCRDVKQNAKVRRRLWWCPVGQFAFLPLHAAGIYNSQPEVCVSDYFVTSYTPTLETLLEIRDRPPATCGPSILAAIQPDAGHGYEPLPNTKAELQAIYDAVPADYIIPTHADTTPDLEGQHTTVQNIMNKLEEASILHLACHGDQDAKDPLRSGFILRNGERLTVKHLMHRPLPNAFMAFLSACHTAANDAEQPDEAINLSSAMLFAGFRTVVATMWPMGDLDGPVIAREVYSRLFDGSGNIAPDFCLATAVDAAVRELRRTSPLEWERWATFIHVGI
ncbi:hypothetical protein K474DRAFT_1627365 [Panus rudis PR-1116 ss-1]|nr:hypothetical protein K474DRAFT_1627365 [Panus rudis PR-1116 ss-1]